MDSRGDTKPQDVEMKPSHPPARSPPRAPRNYVKTPTPATPISPASFHASQTPTRPDWHNRNAAAMSGAPPQADAPKVEQERTAVVPTLKPKPQVSLTPDLDAEVCGLP
jgi:hypothetical protein